MEGFFTYPHLIKIARFWALVGSCWAVWEAVLVALKYFFKLNGNRRR